MGCVYKIINSVNDKIYVGQTTMKLVRRLYFHQKNLTGKSIITKAINKHGIENFSIVIIEEMGNELLNEREIYWIKTLNSKIPNGYNLTDGGSGVSGYKHSEEHCRNLSISSMGCNNNFYDKKHTSDAKLIIGLKGKNRIPWNKGKKMSVISKNKLKDKITEKWKNGDYLNRNINYNDENRVKKISDKLKGKKPSFEIIEKRKMGINKRYEENGKSWGVSDMEIIASNYQILSDKEMQIIFFPNRTYNSVRSMRNKMNLKRK